MNVSWNGSASLVKLIGLAYGRAFRLLVQSMTLEGNENVTGITVSMFGCSNPADPSPIGTQRFRCISVSLMRRYQETDLIEKTTWNGNV